MLNTCDLDCQVGVENASTLRNVANDIIAKYMLEKYRVSILYSNKLKMSGGNITADIRTMNVIIKLNYSYFKNFGIERSVKTLKHELAHLIQFDKRGKMSHNSEFKAICTRIGGSMSSHMAGHAYAASATEQFAERTFKYSYICPTCKTESKRVRRMSEEMRNSTRHSCAKCRTRLNKFIEKEL